MVGVARSALWCLVALAACSDSVPDQGAAPDAGSGEGADASRTPPEPPASLTRYLSGSAEDVVPEGARGGLVLAGGGADVDEAMSWAIDQSGGGDVLVLRTSGADGYNPYLYEELGGVDSVETLLVTERELAESEYLEWSVDHAEFIFFAGGDQWSYLDTWRGTAMHRALGRAWERGAVIGGTSAGCAILGQLAFSAENDTVYSEEALADPYNPYMQFEEGFFALPDLRGVITDTHFAQRDRMGRLLGFLARMQKDALVEGPALGLGVDEGTALLIDREGIGRVVGQGRVHLVRPTRAPEECEPGMPLSHRDLEHWALGAGAELMLSEGRASGAPAILQVVEGVLSPADPY